MEKNGEEPVRDFVDDIEDDLRNAEKTLEEIGSRICGFRWSSTTCGYINEAVGKIEEAIHMAYLMRAAKDEEKKR